MKNIAKRLIALLVVTALSAALAACGVLESRENEAVLAANERAVRGYAVSEILGDTTDKYTTTKSSGEKVLEGPWYVHAEVSASGEISKVKIYKEGEQSAEGTLYKAGENKKDGDKYLINLEIKVLTPTGA